MDEVRMERLEDAGAEAQAQAKAPAAALSDCGGDLAAQIREAIGEALRLGGLTPEARAEEAHQAREAALKAREAELTRRELRAEAQALLAGRGLPSSLCEALDCADRAAMERSVAALEGAFGQAVRRAVEERLRGASPVAGAPLPPDEDMDDETYYRALRLRGKR